MDYVAHSDCGVPHLMYLRGWYAASTASMELTMCHHHSTTAVFR
uniref:Uncharacterized protein n=1 Tax=Parascaris equorum TaxID=6256 RepID=A0A914S548_PAREQ